MPADLTKPFAVDREQLAWAAGLFEGEGTFSTRNGKNGGKRDRGLVAKLKMADEDVVRKFYNTIGTGHMTGPYPCDGAGRKPLWIWQTGSFEGVQHTMISLYEWLQSRRRLKILELLTSYHSKSIEYAR